MNLLLLGLIMLGWQTPAQGPDKTPAAAPKQGAQPFNEVWSIDFGMPVVDNNPPKNLEQAIAQALANHPDMRLVEAELRVAEAKLAQARIQISQKVTEAFHQLQKERADVELANANWERMTKLLKNSAISQEEYRLAQNQLASAKARLATTESAWKLMMGSSGTRVGASPMLNKYLDSRWAQVNPNMPQESAYTLFRYLNVTQDPVYEVYRPVPDKSDSITTDVTSQLKAKLGTRVKLEKQAGLNLEQAFQKVSEGAGLKVRVKLPITENKAVYKVITQIDLEANDYPLRTWLQLIVDEMNSQQSMTAKQSNESPKRYELYVREYGLLLTSRDLAPPDAVTVQELWKQSQFEKAAAEAKKTQESPPAKK